MPATFEGFGVRFLYPDNWQAIARDDDEGESGVTLELPSGGFFSVERVDSESADEALIDELAKTVSSEYDEVERETVELTGAGEDELTTDLSFYYLDLIVVSRIVLLHRDGQRIVVQIQAESRDFDQNEAVFAAILAQLRGNIG